jgi:hypothetical protein
MPFLNLTDEQKELLRILVSNYEAGARVFWFTRGGMTGISYPKGDPASVLCDEMDLDQLRRNGFVSVTKVSRTTSQGKPTQLGIDTVHEKPLPKVQAHKPAISIQNINEYPSERSPNAKEQDSDDKPPPLEDVVLRTAALGVLSDLLLRTKSSLPTKNPFPEDDPKHRWLNSKISEIAKHYSDLAKRFPTDNADLGQFEGWTLDCLKAYFVGSALEMLVAMPNMSPGSLAAHYDFLDSLSDSVKQMGELVAPHLSPSFLAALPLRITKWRESIKATALPSPKATEGGVPEANKPGATEPRRDETTRTEAGLSVNEMNPGTDRRKAVDAYIEEVFSRTGKRLTRTAIWKSAGYKSRTEFERWERNDTKNPNKTAHERFTRILTEKPHLN